MTMAEQERVVNDFGSLPEETRQALSGFVEGAQILEIVTAHAHGVVETSVNYLRDGKVYDVIYDETTRKLLGGSEPAVFDRVIEVLPESGRAAVKVEAPQRIRKIKIKHDDKDHREYVHLHTIDQNGNISSRKLELDGRNKQ
ncbi:MULTISPECIES: hypothetical protein [unclassified Halomonas]|jgi:hypothetical protein|uniref:hypothetical protein n=1 Tax=unclassified Halomonas TaxID=2609666 RepID=UPI000289FC3E|nr:MULTISPECIES: hypothetical protein [unclassified Halomonas]MCE8040067.1 hypothetical protein [Halomonas sp. MCCC 1A11062]